MWCERRTKDRILSPQRRRDQLSRGAHSQLGSAGLLLLNLATLCLSGALGGFGDVFGAHAVCVGIGGRGGRGEGLLREKIDFS